MAQRQTLLGELLREARRGFVVVTMVLGATTLSNAAPTTLMLYGDSLMAGYGLPADQGFAAQLEAALARDGFDVTIANASVSGDTSAAALARLDWSLADRPDAVLLGLGGNDMLQGLSPEGLESNLTTILDRLRQDHIPVLLMGMRASPQLGSDYVAAFDATYPKLAEEFGVPLYGFFLDGVALDTSLNQADRIHPNANGVAAIVERVLPDVEALLNQL